MTSIELPEILDIPEKLLPIITDINNYNYFLIEGGRGSAKSHSIARLLTYLSEQRRVRIVCGREQQNSIEESVKKLFDDIISDYELNFDVYNTKIDHCVTKSAIRFKGFKEQGRVNIKGLEGVDILWIDEAEAITKATLDIIIPTIRKKNSIVIFSMNRHVRKDPVYDFLAGRKDCLHIHINYDENKHCPEKIKNEAEDLKKKNYKEYLHIYKGQPLDQAKEYLFNTVKLDRAKEIRIRPERFKTVKIMSIDLSGNGGDMCVASRIESISSTHFECIGQREWNESDTDITKGKIVNLYNQWKPDLVMLDADGMGYPIYVSARNTIGDNKVLGFYGNGKSKRANAGNQRADGYLTVNEYIENECLKINSDAIIKQLEYTKKVYKPNGLIYIQEKKEMKLENGESPDNADSLMMGIYALNYFSHMLHDEYNSDSFCINSDFDPFE